MKRLLLIASTMTLMERKAGRFLRAPDGHPEGSGIATNPEASGHQELPGGVQRYTPPAQVTGSEAPSAPAAPQLPEGYDSWEKYGQDVAAGKIAPPQAQEGEQQEGQQEKAPELSPELAAKLEPFNAEFTESGTLSDESVAKAAAEFGVSEDMVRQYLAGAANEQTQAAAAVAEFHGQTGGAEGYAEFQQWSVDGMTAGEQKSLNDAYASGNKDAALALQQKFVDRWKAEGNGPQGKDLTRNTVNKASTQEAGYASLAEQKRDQADPRYASDEAFRNRVIDKISRSNY
jgi:hypothetical protein